MILKALEEKDKGNEHFLAGNYVASIIKYSEAIKFDSQNPDLYSNRAAGNLLVIINLDNQYHFVVF